MPRLYLNPNQLLLYPEALAFQFQIQQLSLLSGALDQLLARASRRVDKIARKRIQAPPTTTVGTGGITAGSTTLPVTSTLGFDNDQEQAVVIGPPGGAQEMIPLLPGGVQVSVWAPPYPGNLVLAQPAAYTHNAGDMVQGCYQEISTVGSSGSNDPLEQAWVQFDQGAQVAAAHAPYYGTGMLTRVIFLKRYPITSVLKIEHMLPFDSQYGTLDISRIGVQVAAGYVRLALGSFVLPEGLMRITYTAGFTYVPDEIADATAKYAAHELLLAKIQGADELEAGKVKGKYWDKKTGKSHFELDAERIIDQNYQRKS